jgi:hypothetical protein
MFAFGLSKRLSGQRPKDETPTEALIRTRAAKMPLLNAHLACLYTASGRLQALSPPKMIISPEAVIAMESFEEDGGTTMDERFGAMMLGRWHGAYLNLAYPKDIPTNLDWRLSRGITFEVDTVAESFRLFDEILLHPAPDTLVLVDLYARGCKAYEDANFDLCLITAWAVTEKLLHQLWERYLDDNRRKEIAGGTVTFVNTGRKKRLEDNRTFSAAVISEILSLVSYLPLPLYQDMTEVRRARNDWVHGLKPVSKETAAKAIRVAERILEQVHGISLAIPLLPGRHRQP